MSGQAIQRILCFNVSGKFAHFRKFYTNASALSYWVPPRTVIIGMLASLLKMPRDSYYHVFNETDCRVSVRVAGESSIRSSTQSINLLHNEFQAILIGGKGKSESKIHSQNKMELLFAGPGDRIVYQVFVALPDREDLFDLLMDTVSNGGAGYGLYLGQRQFRAVMDGVSVVNAEDFQYPVEAETMDSVCLQENVIQLADNDNVNIIMEQMPVHMKAAPVTGRGNKKTAGDQHTAAPNGRETISVKRCLFERDGKPIDGRFKNACRIKIGSNHPGHSSSACEKIISFY